MQAVTSKVALSQVDLTAQELDVLSLVAAHSPLERRGKTAAELASFHFFLDSYAVNRRAPDLVAKGLIDSCGSRSFGKRCTIKSREQGKTVVCMYFWVNKKGMAHLKSSRRI